jgi:hypothetical protein
MAEFGELAPDDKSAILNKLQTVAIHCINTMLYIPLNSPLAFGIVARWRRKTQNSQQFYLDKIDLTYDNRQFCTTKTTNNEDPDVAKSTLSAPTDEDLMIGPNGDVPSDMSVGINMLLKDLRRVVADLKRKESSLNDTPILGTLPVTTDAYGMKARTLF